MGQGPLEGRVTDWPFEVEDMGDSRKGQGGVGGRTHRESSFPAVGSETWRGGSTPILSSSALACSPASVIHMNAKEVSLTSSKTPLEF